MGRSEEQRLTTVCLVEYNPLAAAHLCRLLTSDPSLQVFTHNDILENSPSPDEPSPVFILDRQTLPTALSRYLRTVRLRFSDARILVLDDPLPSEELCRLLFLGIQGFLPYHDADEKLLEAIRALAEGHLWVTPEVLEQYVRFSAQVNGVREQRGAALTRQEKRILDLVQRRLSNKEISAILDISESTVKFHIGNLFDKLGVHDRQTAVELVNARGLASLRPEKVK